MPVPDRLVQALADRYRIERELGQGGMATVYLATDLKHGREVAIKVLQPDLAQSLTSERFLREIAITARLNHPHILALLDSGAALDGALLYYVMPVATGESVQDRLTRTGALPVDEALRVSVDVAEALVHAHAQGVVHRDIKPSNVLLSAGHAIVADFGIAKALGDARDVAALTSEGMSLGTPGYMAPEQAAGEANVDHRADIYALGAMLFEMVSGEPPFSGSWQKVVARKIVEDAPSLADKAPNASPALVSLVARCLARSPDGRPQTAEALLGELRELAAPKSAPVAAKSRVPIIAAAAAVLVIAVASYLVVKDRRARWLHEEVFPEFVRMFEADQLDSAFSLAELAERRVPGDSVLALRVRGISTLREFRSEPAGAVVTRAPLTDTTTWVPVGTTPTAATRVPNTPWLYRYSLPGYRSETVLSGRMGGENVDLPNPVRLQRITDPDTGMVLLPGGELRSALFGASTEPAELSEYLMDRLEVTNREFKAFVDAGGYTRRELWDSTITLNGRALAWEAAVARFTDRTGRRGPSTWEGSAPPQGQEDFPVGGVSWYEARAYARFAGKELPTLPEWSNAAVPEAARWIAFTGRLESSGPVRGGSSIGPRGVFDVAGNVREWLVNPREPGTRFIVGGGWSDPRYFFTEAVAQPEFDRSAINGIRLVRRLREMPGLAVASAQVIGQRRDYRGARPVDDATFRALLALYEYDRTPIEPTLISRDTSAADWIREDVSFPIEGESGPMQVAVFLPKRGTPPYQTAILWPASEAFSGSSPQHITMTFVDYLVRSGRAVVHPILEHTYGRGTPMERHVPTNSVASRDQTIRWMYEFRRSVDYVVTRPDVDTTRLAHMGVSWGGRMAGIALALESRFKVSSLLVAGLPAQEQRPETDPVNFLPRIRIPVLMLSGRLDSTFPLETSARPFFEFLGSPASQKMQVIWDGGHYFPRNRWVAETLEWYDRYLGPVGR
ncbi:MAG: protein kinase [Gemmatimonadaceae bacterium]|nr:protein kinase [Gemmatimonadaceae bacterium]